MVWWQYLIISLASITLGAFIGYFLNKRGVQNERDAREQRQLRDAVQSLLTEVNANLKLTEKGVEPALLPRLAKDMWNIHKSNVAELSPEIQEILHQAYSSIDKVNALIDNMYAFGSRQNYGPGAWDERYRDEAKRARKPMEKARDALQEWLKEPKRK